MGTRTSALLLSLIILLVLPGTAAAAETLVSREVETTTGMEMVGLAATSLTDIDIGSSATTITMEIDGQTRSMELDYASVMGTGTNAEGKGSFFGALALLGVGAGAVMRFVRLLMRLGG